MARDEAYREASQRIEEARRSRAIELTLSKMELTEVPETIAIVAALIFGHLTAAPPPYR